MDLGKLVLNYSDLSSSTSDYLSRAKSILRYRRVELWFSLQPMSTSMGQTRRAFLKQAAMASAVLTNAALEASPSGPTKPDATGRGTRDQDGQSPWYRRTYRWGQTNITEADPASYDIDWWRAHWKRTRVQGVIINAGGIVAYYPSQYPLQYRPKTLGHRDLYGELAHAAHGDGLAVLARMDSNRAHEEFYRTHPDWFTRDQNGNPYRAGDLYVTCINSAYYSEWIPKILREIIERTSPEGITDNSWSGLGRANICFCENCVRQFKARTGKSLPREKNWSEPVYREWIQWNYGRRLEIWDLNNEVTKAAGGPTCLWIGMNSGSISGQCQTFRPYKAICERAEIIMLDHQARNENSGFQQNGQIGKLIHGLLGWDKLIPESMAMYQAGRPTFRKASKPEPEARLWVLEGFAGSIQPWWHHVGASQEDRRQFRTIEPLNRWHQVNETYLINRRPIATVGVVWSQQNTDFYGRDHAEELVELPLRGVTNALIRARIPYLPVHVDHIERDGPRFALLILPNLAALSDAQVASIRRFVKSGGGLLATGESSLLNEFGDPRPDYALADLFGAHLTVGRPPLTEAARAKRAAETLHTYLRLGPNDTSRNAVLQGFAETDLLPFGGSLDELTVGERTLVPLTFVPAFPIYPPETSWMREPKTSIPGLILNTAENGRRVAFLPADIDRRFGRDHLPDHGDLIANLVRWAGKDDFPLQIEGPGFIDCHLYRQANRLIVHLVNLTSAGTGSQPVHELIPVGPLQVRVRFPDGFTPTRLRLLVAERHGNVRARNGWVTFELKSILDHEVAVIS